MFKNSQSLFDKKCFVVLDENDSHVARVYFQVLEVPRPLDSPYQAPAAMLLPGKVTATAWLPTYDVISARLTW